MHETIHYYRLTSAGNYWFEFSCSKCVGLPLHVRHQLCRELSVVTMRYARIVSSSTYVCWQWTKRGDGLLLRNLGARLVCTSIILWHYRRQWSVNVLSAGFLRCLPSLPLRQSTNGACSCYATRLHVCVCACTAEWTADAQLAFVT